ncbi:MAG: ABC transporter ATP-binding protein [candidate division Zixibacteria bacterium]|nr:ABC transporter ATP-binding protein [candidate division Zixibacteria bacterium]
MVTVEAYGITKVFSSKKHKKAVVALDAVDLAVPQGEVYGLLGDNGAGKSTLFKTFLGLVKPDSGEIFINGHIPSNPFSRSNVGYLPANPKFPGHLTARQLLLLTGNLYNMNDRDLRERIDGLLKMVGLHHWPTLKIKKFSKGLTQKVGLAQALISDPDLLILDEPFEGLDDKDKPELMKVIDKVRSEAKTILISSPFRSDVESLADRIGIMKKGRIVQTIEINVLREEEKCMFEIEAGMGGKVVDIPAEIGIKLRVTTTSMVVELVDAEKINYVIDQMRKMGISIRSIKPLKTKLEQALYRDIKPTVEPESEPEPKVTV